MRHHYLRITLSIFTLFLFYCGREKNSEPTAAVKKKLKVTEAPFNELDVFIETRDITDWGKIQKIKAGFYYTAPDNAETVAKIVHWAKRNHIPLRIRGRGHSMDGRSLPEKKELLVLTENLRKMKKIGDTEIEIGAGVSLFAVNQWLSAFGRTLPVHNDGIVGPSVGGFISAGGIGRGSRQHGGFWNNVTEVTLVNGQGEIVRISQFDPDFPWLFGSMGQLGIITSAKLKVIAIENAKPTPLPESSEIEENWEKDAPIAKRTNEAYTNEYLYWFSIFAPAEDEKLVRSELNLIKTRNPNLLKYTPEYFWPMKFFKFSPPLVFQTNRNFICLGLWGHLDPAWPASLKVANATALEMEIHRLLQKHPQWRRYIQTEFIPGTYRLNEYFRPQVLKELKNLKRRYDPDRLINPITKFLE